MYAFVKSEINSLRLQANTSDLFMMRQSGN